MSPIMRLIAGFTVLFLLLVTSSFANSRADMPISRSVDHASKEYVVWPADGTNNAQLATTEESIKMVTNSTDVCSYRDIGKALVLWTVTATDSQISQIEANAGVLQVDENVEVGAPN